MARKNEFEMLREQHQRLSEMLKKETDPGKAGKIEQSLNTIASKLKRGNTTSRKTLMDEVSLLFDEQLRAGHTHELAFENAASKFEAIHGFEIPFLFEAFRHRRRRIVTNGKNEHNQTKQLNEIYAKEPDETERVRDSTK